MQSEVSIGTWPGLKERGSMLLSRGVGALGKIVDGEALFETRL